MDVGSVCMSGYRKSMIPLGEAHGQLIAEPVCFLRRDLSRLEGLPDLIGDDISFVLLPVTCWYCRLESRNFIADVSGSQA